MRNKNVSYVARNNTSNKLEEFIASGLFQKVTRYFLNHSEEFEHEGIKSLNDMSSKIATGNVVIKSDKITNEEFMSVLRVLIKDKHSEFMISDIEKVLRFYCKVLDHEVSGTVLAGSSLISLKALPYYFECVTDVSRDQNLSYSEKVDIVFITINTVIKDLPELLKNMPSNFRFIFIYFTEMFRDISMSKEKMEHLLTKIPDVGLLTTSEIMNKLIRKVNSDYVNEKMLPIFVKKYYEYTGIPQIEIDSLVYQINFQYELKQPYSRKIMNHVVLKASDSIVDKKLKDIFHHYLRVQQILTNKDMVSREISASEEETLKSYLFQQFQKEAGTSKEFFIHDYHRSRSPLTKGSSRFYNYFNMANNFSVVMDLLLDYLNKVGSDENFDTETIEGKTILKEWLAPYYDFTMFSEAKTFIINARNNAPGVTSPLSQAAASRGINLISLDPVSFDLFKQFIQATARVAITPALKKLLFINGTVRFLTNSSQNIVSEKKKTGKYSKRYQNYGSLIFNKPVTVNNVVNSIEGLYYNHSDIGLIKMEYIMNSSVMNLPSFNAYLLYYGLAIEKAKKQISIDLIDITGGNDFRGQRAVGRYDDAGLIDDGIAWEIKNPSYKNLSNQLLAIITLAERYPEKEIEIIIPKVRNIAEVQYFKEVLMGEFLQIHGSTRIPDNIHIGIMVETLTLLNDQTFKLYKQAKPLEININNEYLKLSDDFQEDKNLKQLLIEYIDKQDLIDENGYPIRLFTRADATRLKHFINAVYKQPNESLYILLKDILIGACQGFMEKRKNYLDKLFNQQRIINKLEQILLLTNDDNNSKPFIERVVVGTNRLDQSIKGQLKGMNQEGSYSYVYFIIMRNLAETIAKTNINRQQNPLKVTVIGTSASDERFVPVMLDYFKNNELVFATKNPLIYDYLKVLADRKKMPEVKQLVEEIINKRDSSYSILQKLDKLYWKYNQPLTSNQN